MGMPSSSALRVFEAPGEDAARRIMDEEPATDSGAWSCHLEPMRGEVDEPGG